MKSILCVRSILAAIPLALLIATGCGSSPDEAPVADSKPLSESMRDQKASPAEQSNDSGLANSGGKGRG